MNKLDRFFEVVGIVAIVVALYYRKELLWAYQNRATLGQVSDAAGLYSEIKGAL